MAVGPLLLPNYQITLMNYIGLSALVALGLVLLTGIGGLTSFGQAAFVGIGAYTSAYLTTVYGVSPWLSLFAGFLVVGLAAAAIGAVTLRLSGHFLPLSTIAWSISLYFLAGNIAALGGHDGLTGVPPVSIFGHELRDTREYCYLIWSCVLLAMLSVANLLNSRSGRAIRCLRGRVIMAEAFGIDTVRLKLLIFVHAALLASLSGWLYAHLLLFVNPTPFGIGESIEYLFMAVIGGGRVDLGGARRGWPADDLARRFAGCPAAPVRHPAARSKASRSACSWSSSCTARGPGLSPLALHILPALPSARAPEESGAAGAPSADGP